jgi:hypothetical protein
MPILKRSTGKLQNNQFVKILNAQPHLFPIRNGRKMDFRTIEITDRTKEDNFTFESHVDYVKTTPNANPNPNRKNIGEGGGGGGIRKPRKLKCLQKPRNAQMI